MTPRLFYTYDGPWSRSVLLTIKALDLQVDYQAVDLDKGEHLKQEFLKINPQHTVPTLKIEDFVMWESQAINAYLASKFGKDDSLYPKDLEKRAIVDQRLHFDSSILLPRLKSITVPLKTGALKTIPKQNADSVLEAYSFLDTFLKSSEYVAGDGLTIADFAVVASVTSMNIFVPIASSKFLRLSEWLRKIQALPYYAEASQSGLDKSTSNFKKILER